MNCRQLCALSAFTAISQLLNVAPVLATSIADDRHSTDVVARLLGDARSARLALISNDTIMATRDIDYALAERANLVRIARAHGKSMVVQIYTELDDNAALSYDFMTPERVPNETRARHMKSLEVTYFAIDLNKARTRLDAAQRAVRAGNDRSAEDSLEAIRSDLVHGNNVADAPLLAARRDLVLAQGDISHSQLGAASSELGKASDSLKGYSSAGHKVAAHQLADDIRSSVRLSTQSGSTVSTKIDGWWASLKTWFSQHA